MDGEPLGNGKVKEIILRCLDEGGVVFFTEHARQEMANDSISEAEALGVLRSGVVDGNDLIDFTWRYRVRRTKTYVVVAFDSETMTIVVTAWRKS